MGYSTQQGETNQPQSGGTFEGGQISGATTQAQKGGVFDGVVVIDGPTGPAGPPGPLGPTINVTASANAVPGTTAAANVAVTYPSTNTENLAFSFVLPQGGTGPSGPAGTVAVGTVAVNALVAGSPPTVTVTDTGTPQDGILNFTFGIPAGAAGALNVGTVTTTTGAAGTQASVTITPRMGMPGTFDFVFVIPRGDTGAQGPQGTAGAAATITAGTATALPSTSAPTVTNSGTSSAAVFNFGIPAGQTGATGATGATGPAGRGVVSVTATSSSAANNIITVTLTETFTDNTTQTTSFSFTAGNNLLYGSGNPFLTPSVIPGLYVNTDNRSLWAYLTTSWIEIGGGGSATTIVSNNDGTVTVTPYGTNDFDVKIAQQGALTGNYLYWNGTRWAPRAITYNLASTANNMTFEIDGGTIDIAPIINSFVNTSNPTQNQLSFSVNGITADQEPIIAPAAFATNGLSFTPATSTLMATINGIQSNPVVIPSGAGGTVNLTEPAWRSVSQSTVGNTENIVVTDDPQVPTQFFAGTNAPVFSYTNPTAAQLGLSQATSQVIITGVGIDGVFGGVFSTQLGRTPDQAYLDCQNPLTSRFWYAQSGYVLSGLKDFWQAFEPAGTTNHTFVYQRALNGTSNPIHSDAFLSIRFVNFTGGTSGNTLTIIASLNNALGTPAFRPLYMPDIESLFTPGSYPDTGQVATWQDGAPGNTGTISWVTTPPIATTTVVGTDGINVSSNQVGTNTEWVVKAALEAQNSGTAIQGTYFQLNARNNLTASLDSATNVLSLDVNGLTAQENSAAIAGNFYTINAGANISASVTNGILTLSSTGGGGGGDLAVTSAWASGGTNKQAYNNATGPTQGTVNTQGVTLSLVATTSVGPLTNAFVKFNNVLATGTYTSTGTFPNYTITVPASAVPLAAQTAASVVIEVDGTYQGLTSIYMGGTLTNTQPRPAIVGLTLMGTNPTPNPRAYYNPSGTNGSIVASATVSQGTIASVSYALDGAPTQGSGNFSGVGVTPNPHSVVTTGTANGQFGAPLAVPFNVTNTVAITQGVYTPAFYLQTLSSTIPPFTTNSTQTPGEGQGSVIMYPAATLTTQYNWVLTNRPIGNLFLRTPFGDNPLTAQVTNTQVLSGTTFNLFGWTDLGVGKSSMLVIT